VSVIAERELGSYFSYNHFSCTEANYAIDMSTLECYHILNFVRKIEGFE